MTSRTKSAKKGKKTKAYSASSSGIAMALTAFIVSIFLYFQPNYYGPVTNGVAIALIVLGIMGLGFELEKISSGQWDNLTGQPQGSGIFDNLGIGLGFLVVWATVYYYFPMIWVNVLTSVVLLFGVYGTILGVLNWFFGIMPRGLVYEKRIDEAGGKASSAPADNSDKNRKPWSMVTKIAIGISGATAFLASLLQILQILKIIK